MKTLFQITAGLTTILLMFSTVLAQENDRRHQLRCSEGAVGFFRQLTGTKWEVLPKTLNTLQFERELPKGTYPLADIEIVDPAFMFEIKASDKKWSGAKSEVCPETVIIAGELVAPNGKIFAFQKGAFNIKTRKVEFETVEQDRIIYFGELEFFADFTKNAFGRYVAGHAKVRARGRYIGVVSFEFDFDDYSIVMD